MVGRFALAVVLALAVTAGAAAADRQEAARHAQFTVDSTLAELLDNPGARAVLERHLPEIVANPAISQSTGMSLRSLAQFLPQLTESKLAEINADLAALDGAPFFQ